MKADENIFCERSDFGTSISIRWVKGRDAAKNVTFESVKKGEYVPPFANISKALAQKLMDELWICGLRPSEGTGSAGSLAATERHLEDMRKLAFHKIMPKDTK